MANTNRPQGLVPIRHTNGAAWNGQYQLFYVPTTDATAIYVGDPVKLAGSAGTAGQNVSGYDVEGLGTVSRDVSGTTGVSTVGVCVGFLPNPAVNGPSSNVKHRAASTAAVAMVVTDPTVIFEIQEDGVGANLAATDVGMNCSYVTTAGSTTTGLSGVLIDSSATPATTVTLPLKLIGLSKRVDNAIGTASTDLAKYEVMFNTGIYQPNSVGV